MKLRLRLIRANFFKLLTLFDYSSRPQIRFVGGLILFKRKLPINVTTANVFKDSL